MQVRIYKLDRGQESTNVPAVLDVVGAVSNVMLGNPSPHFGKVDWV